MKLATIILLVVNLHVSATTFGQNVSISARSISLKQAFVELRAQTGYYFIYNDELVSNAKPVQVDLKNVDLEKALKELFKAQPFTYTIKDKIIIVKAKENVSSVSAEVQNRTITGTVLDAEDGTPLPGVSVRVKGNAIGTVTSVEGNFSLVVKSTDLVLQLNYIGYAVKEVPLTSDNKYTIRLSVESKQLKEVVIAFGTSTKRELTGAVTEITAKDIEQRPISNLNSAIVGAAPGVQTSAGSGQPGDGPSIRIRGFSSITNSNDPLYILDGAPYEGDISDINPEDIESINLLKDAASTALYGARAANGVVMITTKKGRKDKNTIAAKLTQAVSERSLPNYERVNAYEYYPLIWESIRNGYISDYGSGYASKIDSINLAATNNVKGLLGWNPFNVADNEIVLPNGTINPDARLLYPNDLSLRDAMQRTGLRSDLSLSFSGGNVKNDYYFSLSYLDEQGFSIGSDFKRYSGRVKLNSQPRKWLSTGLSITGTFSESGRANENSGINENPFYVDLLMAPIYPVYRHDPFTGAYLLDENGMRQYDAGDYRPLMTGRNILAETTYNINNIRRNVMIANSNVDVKFLKDFKFSTNFSTTLSNYRSDVIDNSIIGDALGRGRASLTNRLYAFLNFNQLLNYTKKIGDHSFKALLGHESYMNYFEDLRASATSEATSRTNALSTYAIGTGYGGNDRDYRTEGYLSKIDYSYMGKYVASASFRRDGSSKFAKENRWGNFWSVSGAWNIDKESFFKLPAVDLLKLRASYGEVGNDNVGDYFAYQGLYTLGYNNGTEPGALLTSIQVDSLQWETNVNMDVALDFGIFKSRISGSVEYFRRQSQNLLFDIALPLSTGLTTRNDNFGSMLNEGLEIQLTGQIIKKKNLGWTSSINWTSTANRIVSLPDSYKGYISGKRRYAEGRSIYEFWLRDWRGVDPQTGADLFTTTDQWVSPVISSTGEVLTSSSSNARFRYAGSAIPDFFGSVNNTFSYKNLSLQLMFIYQVGGLVYDDDYQTLMTRGTLGRAMHKDVLTRWQEPGDITDVPRLEQGSSVFDSDRFLIDASYLNFRTASLTYNLPKKFLKRYSIPTAKAYVSGENLFITSKRKGLDPTQTYTGTSSYTYAPARLISLGINFTL